MEEDKNKRNKRNKKKKNKQATKPTENVTLDARESTSNSQSHVQERGEDNNSQVSLATHELDAVAGDMAADKDGNRANDIEGKNLAEVEERWWLGREASFQEKIKEQQAEKDAQIQNQASLEEKIKQLLMEKDENLQKEAGQRDKIEQLQDEKKASMQNEASLKEKLMQLEKEKDALVQKEGSLEQKIEQLLQEMDAHTQKEASLETKILQLEAEKESSLQKEVQNFFLALREKSNQLLEEAAGLNFEGVSLQEKLKQMEGERDSWILEENSAKESIATLTNNNAHLRAQVIELEQARETLLEEKKLLKEIISSLNLQIQNLGSVAVLSDSSMGNKATSKEDMDYQIEAAQALVDKLIAENSEPVEKMNELYAELDQTSIIRTEHFSTAGSNNGAASALSGDGSSYMPNLAVGADGWHGTAWATDSTSGDGSAFVLDLAVGADDGHETAQATDSTSGDGSAFMPNLAVGADDEHGTAWATDSSSETSKKMPMSGRSQSLEDIRIEYKRNGEHVNVNGGYGVGNSSEIIKADEIVQIPLGENDVKEINLEVAQNNENTDDVPLTDAPLIGAPFRIISFVARYVSGADLVNKNAGNSG